MESGEESRADGDVTTGSVLSESSSSSPIDDHGSSQPTTEENSEVESEGVDSQPPTTVRKKWANPLPPCRVCASPSSGLHYGVNTCESCKAFFKRCLKRKRPLQCKGMDSNVCVLERNISFFFFSLHVVSVINYFPLYGLPVTLSFTYF